jgi:hypothetical protein
MFSLFIKVLSCLLIIQSCEVFATTTERQPHLISADNQKQSRKKYVPRQKIETKYEPTWESLDSRPLPQWYDDAKIGESIECL